MTRVSQHAVSEGIRSDWASYAASSWTFEVPEISIDGAPLQVHVWPLTMGDESYYRRLLERYPGNDKLALIFARARNDDRSLIFHESQLTTIAPVFRSQLADRIVLEILAGDRNSNGSEAQEKKDSETAPGG